MKRNIAVSRRAVLAGLSAAVGVSAVAKTQTRAVSPAERVIVIGAGVFGAWSAWHLLNSGRRVTLVDAWGPAHARASSGGESRMTRTAYGRDAVYSRFAWESLEDWRWLSSRAALPVFHPSGVLFFFPTGDGYVADTIEVHRQLGVALQVLEREQLLQRYPQIVWDGVEVALFEPDRGALMARRAVQTLVKEFVAAGGEYRQLAIEPPRPADALRSIRSVNGESLAADQFVFACGPWLPKVFPELLGPRIFPTRQEVFFFAPPAGDGRFGPPQLPGWADFNGGDIYYGFPDLEARGFKIAFDRHGPPIDPDGGDRTPSAEALRDVRQFMRRRFPALAERPLSESRVCQYEISANGDLLLDRHPDWRNVWLVGGGSGHGFKHGPAVGRYVARLVTEDRSLQVELRFSLVSKGVRQHRDVH